MLFTGLHKRGSAVLHLVLGLTRSVPSHGCTHQQARPGTAAGVTAALLTELWRGTSDQSKHATGWKSQVWELRQMPISEPRYGV